MRTFPVRRQDRGEGRAPLAGRRGGGRGAAQCPGKPVGDPGAEPGWPLEEPRVSLGDSPVAGWSRRCPHPRSSSQLCISTLQLSCWSEGNILYLLYFSLSSASSTNRRNRLCTWLRFDQHVVGKARRLSGTWFIWRLRGIEQIENIVAVPSLQPQPQHLVANSRNRSHVHKRFAEFQSVYKQSADWTQWRG